MRGAGASAAVHLLGLGEPGLLGILESRVWVHAGQSAQGPRPPGAGGDLWVDTESVDTLRPGQQEHRRPGEETAWQPHSQTAGDGLGWGRLSQM